jgi:hypothetical protein
MFSYQSNLYYKHLYDAYMDSFVKNKINTDRDIYCNETIFNNNYYSYLAALDFCEMLLSYSDDYVHHNLEQHFESIRESVLDRIEAGKLLSISMR